MSNNKYNLFLKLLIPAGNVEQLYTVACKVLNSILNKIMKYMYEILVLLKWFSMFKSCRKL